MAICPIANSVGCDKCTIVNYCVLKSVLGNYGNEQPEQKPEESKSNESKPPD